MPFVQTAGALLELSTGWAPTAAYGSLSLYDSYNHAYSMIYKTQPNVRTCVDFLARNIAQLGLHVFRREEDGDRQRLRDHSLARLIERPNAWTTRYRLIEALVADLGVYHNAFWLKVRRPDGIALLQVPPRYMSVKGDLVATEYIVDMGAVQKSFAPADVVHFRGYNPLSSTVGLSPLETLRRVLAEEQAMGEYREYFWRNGARMYGIVQRPPQKDIGGKEWSPAARERFRQEFEALYSGATNSGRTAILEDGMTWHEMSFDAQESEYLGARKLTREECARAYHIPLPMVGILDNATFSNIKEQHKNLYQDSLGPWLAMIEQDIQLQLLPDLDDSDGIYCEFNIAEKLAGSFEDQTTALQAAVGRPWMTANEARARLNLPRMEGDADELVTPLNVLVGGQANPQDSAPPSEGEAAVSAPLETVAPDRGRTAVSTPLDVRGRTSEPQVHAKARRGQIDPTHPELRDNYEEQHRRIMVKTFERQRDAIIGKVPEGEPEKAAAKVSVDGIWDAARWNRELGNDLRRLGLLTATSWGKSVTDELDVEFDAGRMDEWIAENSRIAAEEINRTTRTSLADALRDEAPRAAVETLFALAISVRAPEIATTRVTTLSVFGATEGARQGGLKTKTWKVNSGNPRPEHAMMDGETVGLDEYFSNGMRWPGDPMGGAENNSNCKCSVTFGR